MKRRVIAVSSARRVELVDITADAEAAVSGTDEGILHLFSPHTTAALLINEHEDGLISDLEEYLANLAPPSRAYRHDRIDSNATAHMVAAVTGSSLSVPVEGGRLALGTWQRIFLVELDGPRSRRLVATLIP